jgi:hypothetical protein
MIEAEVTLTPDEEAYLAELADEEAEEPGLYEDTEDTEDTEELEFYGEGEDGEPEMADAYAAEIFAPDEVYQADEHALHDELVAGAGTGDEDEEAPDDEGESLTERVQAALRQGFWAAAVRLMIVAGNRDEKQLTNLIFRSLHPEMANRPIRPDEKHLAKEWLTIRDQIVRPLLPQSGGRRPKVLKTAAIRAAWREYLDDRNRMTELRIFGWTTPVNPETVDAWRALERALTGAGHIGHRAWVFRARKIGKTNNPSLHAYGLAIDIDHDKPKCNVNNPTPDHRLVRFSKAATKEERCLDVAAGRADTSFTPAQVAAVEAIRTVDGFQVFGWGGRWRDCKDTMHFQISVTPEELKRGLA